MLRYVFVTHCGVEVVVDELRRDGADDGGLDAAVEGGHAAFLVDELAKLGDHAALRGWRVGGAVAPSFLFPRAMLGVLPGVERHEGVGGEKREERAARAGDRVERGIGVWLHATAVDVRDDPAMRRKGRWTVR